MHVLCARARGAQSTEEVEQHQVDRALVGHLGGSRGGGAGDRVCHCGVERGGVGVVVVVVVTRWAGFSS